MLNVSNNIILLKKGILDTLNLFETLYKKDRNILLFKDKQLFINNIEQLLDKNIVNDVYNFGVNFVLENIKNFRDNICLNPIIYIILLKIIVSEIDKIEDLKKYNNIFKNSSIFLKNFYNDSDLKSAKITENDIKSLFSEYMSDDFIKSVINNSLIDSNVEINESKSNKISSNNYYKIKCNILSNNIYSDGCKFIILNNLNQDVYNYLLNFNENILVICVKCDAKLNKSFSNISVVKIGEFILYSRLKDLLLLTGSERIYDLNFDRLQDLNFGELKEFKFIDGNLYLQANKYYHNNSKEIQYLNKKDTMNRFYMMQGKNIVIDTIEENMEKVRFIVSFIKSCMQNGVFYNEIKTIKLLDYNFNSDIFKNLLKEFINIKSEKDIYFMPVDYYLNTFELLDSNINILSKIY